MRRNEGGRLGGKPCGQVLARRPVGKARIAVGREVASPAARRAPIAAPLVHVEALVFGIKPLRAQVPFAGEERGIAGYFQRLGQRDFGQRHAVDIGRRQQARLPPPVLGLIGAVRGDVIGEPQPLRIFSRQDAGPRRRADRTRRIRLCEFHPRGGQPIDVRRFVERAAETAEIAPT
jgi:hypothetical protein